MPISFSGPIHIITVSYFCEFFIELGPCGLVYIHMQNSHKFHSEGFSGEWVRDKGKCIPLRQLYVFSVRCFITSVSQSSSCFCHQLNYTFLVYHWVSLFQTCLHFSVQIPENSLIYYLRFKPNKWLRASCFLCETFFFKISGFSFSKVLWQRIENIPFLGILSVFPASLAPYTSMSRTVYSFSAKKYCPLAMAVMKVSDSDYRKVILLTECSLHIWATSWD